MNQKQFEFDYPQPSPSKERVARILSAIRERQWNEYLKQNPKENLRITHECFPWIFGRLTTAADLEGK